MTGFKNCFGYKIVWTSSVTTIKSLLIQIVLDCKKNMIMLKCLVISAVLSVLLSYCSDVWLNSLGNHWKRQAVERRREFLGVDLHASSLEVLVLPRKKLGRLQQTSLSRTTNT